jgi:hypothetical protein
MAGRTFKRAAVAFRGFPFRWPRHPWPGTACHGGYKFIAYPRPSGAYLFLSQMATTSMARGRFLNRNQLLCSPSFCPIGIVGFLYCKPEARARRLPQQNGIRLCCRVDENPASNSVLMRGTAGGVVTRDAPAGITNACGAILEISYTSI